ncbi:MAG TPA: hypothetical protein VFU17_02895 [Candidatus Limnocylindrales bacterium]|nr:hypothetical protein [Candidatus Limnocylindrales bacterium]
MIRLLVLAVVVAGCALVPPPADGRLVTVEAHGGRCPDGECRTVFAIESDGLVHQLEPVEADVHRVTDRTIDVYRAALGITDFDAIRSRPFTGECPTAFDGMEVVYTFETPAGPERISSCEVEIDRQAAIFVAVDAILGATAP